MVWGDYRFAVRLIANDNIAARLSRYLIGTFRKGENPSALSDFTGCSCACADLLLGARKWTPF